MNFTTLINKFSTDLETGLSSKQVEINTEKYGKNVLVEIKKKSPLGRLLSHFTSPLILLLLFIAGTLFILDDHLESLLVFMMVVISVILDMWQETKADRAIAKLQDKVAHYCEVVRDNKKIEILATDLIPGDILLLNVGDLISADGIVIEAKDFFVQQAALTGESFPIEKMPPSNEDGELDNIADSDLSKTYVVFDGTSVSSGTAKVLVVNTGKETQFSYIAASLNKEEGSSQFTVGVKKFSKLILKIVAIVILSIFVIYKLMDYGWIETLTFAVAIAVGITPDFLTVIMSLCMSYGARKMAANGVIIKKMSAMPNFGSAEILCTDKTGTITEDKITLIKHTDIFGQSEEDILLYAQLNSHFQSGLSNSMDNAILSHYTIDLNKYKKIDEIPYDFERRALSVVVEDTETRERFLIIKGAPETIYPRLTNYYDFFHRTPSPIYNDIQNELDLQYRMLSEDGFRVLVIAIKRLGTDDQRTTYSVDDENNLEIVGFASFLDPVKEDVKDAIKDLNKINVTVKVITGDSEVIARKICGEAGIVSERIVLGDEIGNLSDNDLFAQAMNANIFARCSPMQKERIIKVLRMSGKSIAYLGDGINDAPSLKAADVGISVDNAVDVAHEAADIILTKKSLAVLEAGMLEGRKTFVNTMKYIRIGVSSSVGNVISLVVAAFLLPFLPILPLQILLNDFVYDMSQLALASDNVDDIQVQKPQKWDLSEIKRFIFIFGPLSSIFDLALFAIMFWVFNLTAAQFQTSWFIFSVFTQMLALFIMRTPRKLFGSKPGKNLVATTLISSLFAMIAVFIPFTIGIFSFDISFPPMMWLVIFVVLGGYIVALEIAKRFYYKKVFA
ncbi:MAG: magnesium-translocating P-type ATPase [Pseudomonadales bacterium]|jgi:Mg2+-importing ATPase|nr:magnesium-translocating P-type ATPase [Pseudomonadales bacterium]